MTDPAIKRRRRKPSPSPGAERMRRLRAERAEPAPVETTPPPAPPTGPTAPPEGAPPAPSGPSLADKEALLAKALAGTVEALADTAQLVWMDPKAPSLGHDRAKLLGELWAPVLAPYIDADLAKWLPLALAAGGTANAAYGWAHEYRAFKEAEARRAAAATPLSVVEGGAAS